MTRKIYVVAKATTHKDGRLAEGAEMKEPGFRG